MLRFPVLGYLDESRPDAHPPPREMFAAVGAPAEQAAKAGVLVETHGLLPSAAGARIRVPDGAPKVARGPFAGPRGTISNYTVLKTASLEEAADWAGRFAASWARRSRSGS